LVAGSGKAKKSTAIADIAEGVLKEARTAVIYDGKITPERLLAKLSTQPSGKAIMTVIQHELTTFLSKQTYNEHMIDIITKLMDCKDDAYETQEKTHVLKDVCCTFLFGTTPRNLGEGVPPQAHDTGFMGRFLFVYGDRSGKVEPLTTSAADPRLVESSLRLRHRLLLGLREFARLNGPFALSPSAKEWFDDWYEHYMGSEESEGEGWAQRKPEHMLRVGMVLSVSRGQVSPLRLDPIDLTTALSMIEEQVEKGFPKCFAYIGRHAAAEGITRILSVFHNRNGAPVSSQELYSRTLQYFGNSQALSMAVNGLRLAGILTFQRDKNGGEWWKLQKEPY